MSEKRLRRYVSDGLSKFGHVSQIESHATAQGFPDTNYCVVGVEGNIELKYYGHKGVVIRKNQIAWARRRIKAGGRVWILIQINKDYLLVNFRPDSLPGATDLTTWRSLSTKIWKNKINWQELVLELTK